MVDQGRWERQGLGSIQPKTCGMAMAGYSNDDISFQRRPEECGGCNLGHIPTPSSVYLHSFILNIQLSLMVAIKKSAVSALTHLCKPVSEILLQMISQILS